MRCLLRPRPNGLGVAWIDTHMTPEDDIQVHLDVSGKRMLPVYRSTFDLRIHALDKLIERAVKASKQKNVRLLTSRVGETITSGKPFTNIRCWEKVRSL